MRTLNNSKAKWLIFVLLMEALGGFNVSCEYIKEKRSVSLTKVVVDSVRVADLDAEKGEAELVVHGVLPNPAYAIDHVEVKVSDAEIRITPWAMHDPEKVVIMMTVPFVEKCKVTKLARNRKYSIKVEGANMVIVQPMSLP